jgi:hypothetical protein
VKRLGAPEAECQLWVDAVEKVADEVGEPFHLSF